MQRAVGEQPGSLAGWGLGLTSRAKQAQVGLTDPVYGFLAARNALDHGAPPGTAELIQPRAEPESVFIMGRDVQGRHVGAAHVLTATAAVAVGVEILGSGYRDYRFTPADLVADNTRAGRYLLGAPVPPTGIDLRLISVVFEHNGEVVATAAGAVSLRHPAPAVAWLVRALTAREEGPRAAR